MGDILQGASLMYPPSTGGGGGGGFDLIIGGNTAGATASVSSGTLTLAGGNNITLSQNGNAISIIGPSPTGNAFSAGISGGNTAGNTGTVSNQLVLAGGNNITLSGSTNAGGMSVTISAPNQSVQTQNLFDLTLAGNTSGTLALVSSGTLTLAGGNNIILSQVGNAITISASNQSVQTQNLFDLTLAGNTSGTLALVSSGTLTLAGGNNITLSQVGNAVTISAFNQSVQTQNCVDLSLSGNSTSAGAGFILISSGTGILAGGNNITLSQNGQSVTISAANQTVQTQNCVDWSLSGNSTSAGAGFILISSGTGILAGGNNITLSQNGQSVTISAFNQSVQTQNLVDVTLAGNSTSAGAGFILISSGTMTLAGGNNVTLSQNGNAVTISAFNQSNQSLGIYASSNTTGATTSSTYDARSLTIEALGNVSVGWSNGSFQISGTQSVQTQNCVDISLSGNTTGTLALISSGTAILAGGNNITLSQNGQSVTISDGMNTVSQFWAVQDNLFVAQSINAIQNGTVFVWPMQMQGFASASAAFGFISLSLSTSATNNSTNSGVISFDIAVYTKTGSTLSLASSGSSAYSWTFTSNGSTASLSGLRMISVPINVNFTPGNYWMGAFLQTTTGGNLGFTGSYNAGVALAAANYSGFFATGSNTSMQGMLGLGNITASTNALPASIAFGNISGEGVVAHEPPLIGMFNITA